MENLGTIVLAVGALGTAAFADAVMAGERNPIYG